MGTGLRVGRGEDAYAGVGLARCGSVMTRGSCPRSAIACDVHVQNRIRASVRDQTDQVGSCTARKLAPHPFVGEHTARLGEGLSWDSGPAHQISDISTW